MLCLSFRAMCAAAVAISILTLPSCSPSNDTGNDTVSVATMRLGSSWYVFGATLSEILRPQLPDGMRVEVMAKGGGIANPLAVNGGDATIGLANVCTSVWAQKGLEVYQGKECANIRALVGGLNPVWFLAIARKGYVDEHDIKSLDEILLGTQPTRIVMKPAGSSVPVIADMVMEVLGTSREKIEANGGRIIQVSAKQIPPMIKDGRADLYFEAGPVGHPGVTELATTADVVFFDLPESVRSGLEKRGLMPSEIPVGYRGQTAPTKSVNLGTLLIVNKDVPDDLVYLLTKAVCDNRDVMARAHKAWSRFDPSQSGHESQTGIPLHPGARRFFEERGWLAAR